MTDKEKIREEVEKLKLCTMDEHMKFYSEAAEGEYNALCNIEHFIDSLQEEPKPKFKIGDKVVSESCKYAEIESIDTDKYWCKGENGMSIPFKYQDKWELVEEPKPKFKVGQTITDPTDPTFTFHINKIEDGRYIKKEDEWVLVKEADANYELVEEPVSEDLK